MGIIRYASQVYVLRKNYNKDLWDLAAVKSRTECDWSKRINSVRAFIVQNPADPKFDFLKN